MEGEEGDIRLRVNPFKGKDAAELTRMLHGWLQAANMLRSGEITQGPLASLLSGVRQEPDMGKGSVTGVERYAD